MQVNWCQLSQNSSFRDTATIIVMATLGKAASKPIIALKPVPAPPTSQ